MFLISILSLSQAGNLIRLANAPVEVIGFWRLAGAFVIMAAVAKLSQGELLPKGISRKSLILTFSSGLFFFVHLYTYFFASKTTTIANSMIIFAANPLFTAFFSVLFMKEKLSKRLGLAYLLAVIGLYQLLSERIDFQQMSYLGNWSALLSAALYSGYILFGKAARREVSNFSYAWIVYLIVAVCFFTTGFIRNLAWTPYPTQTWIAILGTILFPTLLGHALFTYLLKFLNVNWMSCGKLLEPGLSAFIAFLLFQESPTPATYWAFAFTSASVIVLIAPWNKQKLPALSKNS